MTLRMAAALLMGATLGALNFWFLTKVVAGMVRSGEIPKWKTTLFFFGKMAILFVTIGLILWKRYVTPLPFLGGFTVSLVTGILCRIFKNA